ncbi:MAG TPA: hypothetical protein VGM18_12165 [Candidatus Sulfotelmatobacter sp.]|jgi:hypothetical protein
MTIALESMAVVMPRVEGHPNRAGFRGVLTVVDVPSQRAPSGSKGRRVVLTRAAAEAALPSLLGMALDYAPSFDRHDVRRKVGVITSADVVGRNLEVGGFLYAKDFPEIVEEIGKSGRRVGSLPRTSQGRGMQAVAETTREHRWTDRANLRASLAAAVDRLRGLTTSIRADSSEPGPESLVAAGGAGPLGMSYEVADVSLLDNRSRVWILTKVTFTGAAILRKDKAAYQDTWIELENS